VVVPQDRPRAELAAELVDALRLEGVRAIHPSGWEDYDARLLLSAFSHGELQTSAHPEGFVQVRIRFRPRLRSIAAACGTACAGALLLAPALALGVVVVAASAGRGAVRARRLPARILAGEGG
jgi:hypothetical protein